MAIFVELSAADCVVVVGFPASPTLDFIEVTPALVIVTSPDIATSVAIFDALPTKICPLARATFVT